MKIIGTLKQKGFRIFGFTDTKKEHYEANLSKGLYEKFEKVFCSFDIGSKKEEKESFRKVVKKLKKYNLSPSECIFMDDKIKNIKKAKEEGFKCIHYNEFPKTEGLKKSLIKERGSFSNL